MASSHRRHANRHAAGSRTLRGGTLLRSGPCLLTTLLTTLLRLARVEIALRATEGVWSSLKAVTAALVAPAAVVDALLFVAGAQRCARCAVCLAPTEIIGTVGVIYIAIQHLVIGWRASVRPGIFPGRVFCRDDFRRWPATWRVARCFVLDDCHYYSAPVESQHYCLQGDHYFLGDCYFQADRCCRSIVVAWTEINRCRATVVAAKDVRRLKLAAVGTRIVASNIVVVHVL